MSANDGSKLPWGDALTVGTGAAVTLLSLMQASDPNAPQLVHQFELLVAMDSGNVRVSCGTNPALTPTAHFAGQMTANEGWAPPVVPSPQSRMLDLSLWYLACDTSSTVVGVTCR